MKTTYQRWRDEYRPLFGCRVRPPHGCWCEVCCALERAWDEAMQSAKEAIDDIRHPAIVEKEQSNQGANHGKGN